MPSAAPPCHSVTTSRTPRWCAACPRWWRSWPTSCAAMTSSRRRSPTRSACSSARTSARATARRSPNRRSSRPGAMARSRTPARAARGGRSMRWAWTSRSTRSRVGRSAPGRSTTCAMAMACAGGCHSRSSSARTSTCRSGSRSRSTIAARHAARRMSSATIISWPATSGSRSGPRRRCGSTCSAAASYRACPRPGCSTAPRRAARSPASSRSSG